MLNFSIADYRRELDKCGATWSDDTKHIEDTADGTNTKDNKTCDCRQKNTCPLGGNCLRTPVIYQATVTRKDNSTTETYIRRHRKQL